MEIFNKEVFGPAAIIIPAADFLQAVEIANNTKYGLAAAVYTRDVDKALFFSREIRVGSVFLILLASVLKYTFLSVV